MQAQAHIHTHKYIFKLKKETSQFLPAYWENKQTQINSLALQNCVKALAAREETWHCA